MAAPTAPHATIPHSALSYVAAEAAETARLAARLCRLPVALVRVFGRGSPIDGRVGLETADPSAVDALAEAGQRVAAGQAPPPTLPLNLRRLMAVPIASGGSPVRGLILVAGEDPGAGGFSDESALLTLGRRLAETLQLRRLTRELRAAEAAFRASEARYRAVVETIEEGVVVCDARGAILELNPAATHLLGVTRDGARSAPLSRYIPALPDLPGPGEGPEVRETDARRDDGTTFPAAVVTNPIETDEGPLLVAHVRDLSARREIERLRRQFISMVSHELRTPLTSVRASLGLLSLGASGELPEDAKRIVGIAERNAERLVRLINDIIDLERAEGGHLRLHLADTAAREIADRALEAVGPLAEQAGLGIDAPRVEGQARADGERLTQVLVNLLSNAVKFAPRGSRIRITAAAIGGSLVFEVADEGPGIPEAAREMIFEPFRQVEDSDARRTGGSGLGLAICRAIVERHGGSIFVKPNPDGGSTFRFSVPVAGPPA